MTAAHALDALIEEMLPAATELAVTVRDRDTEAVHRILAPVLDAADRDRTAALLIALAVMVPDDATFGDLVAWTHDQDQLPLGQLVIDAAEKWCPDCRQVRATRDFHTDRSRNDGLKYRCRFCCNDANRRREHLLRNGGEVAA
jgi:hypothetical protein